jgi:hypothetical protein
MQFGKWILFAIAAYVAWRFVNGWLSGQQSYNVQSSSYVSPQYPQVPYGYAAANYGFVGYGNGGGWRNNSDWTSSGGWSGGGHRPRTPRVGQPDGSTRW